MQETYLLLLILISGNFLFFFFFGNDKCMLMKLKQMKNKNVLEIKN